jgi:hypothetical protein
MGKPKRLSKKLLQEDIEAYAALQAIAGYHPSNTEFELADVAASHQLMGAKQTDEVQKLTAADAARDAAADSERAFHNMILGAKTQVKAQFGESSDEFASLGMKKKDEYRSGKRPALKKTVNPT